jgi:hypothetical protein
MFIEKEIRSQFMNKPIAVTTFCLSAATLLILTGLAKLYSTLGTSKILDGIDELFLVENRLVLIGAAAAEFAVAWTLVFGRSEKLKLISLLWLSSMFVWYRTARWYFAIPTPCKCLGNLTDNLPFKVETVETGLQLMIVYCFLRRGQPLC